MKTKWFISLVLATATLAGAQTNNLTGLLQQGMFEEQANRNLDAAIATYQSLSTQFDQDRQVAATAVFRLGECYRALGRTAEATAQYQRIIRDFADQQMLVTLSRQDLTGMGSATSTAAQPANAAGSGEASISAEAAALAAQISGIEKLGADPEEQARATLAIFSDEELKKELLDLPELKEQESKLEANPQLTVTDIWGPHAAGLRRARGVAKTYDLSTIDKQAEADKTNLLAAAQRELRNQMTWIQDRVNFGLSLQKARLKALAAGAGAAESPQTATANGSAQLWTQLKDLPTDKLEQVLPTVISDRTLNNLLEQRNEAEAKLAVLTNDYALSSIECARAISLRDELNRQLGERISGIMQGLKMQAELPANVLGGQAGPAAAASTDSDEDREIAHTAQLIQNSPDLINAEGSDGTPLVKAAYNGWQKVAAYLLDHGADVNRTAKVRWSQDLADAGAVTPLMAAVAAGNKAMVQYLISRGADVNCRSEHNRTPLNLAAQKGFSAVAEVLLGSHANVNAKAFGDRTPLMASVESGQIKLVQMMLTAGAEVNSKDNLGRTALNYALANPAEIVEALLRAGADPNTRDQGGQTPLSHAAETFKPEIAKLLLAGKADPNLQDQNGRTPLSHAAETAKPEIVTLLLAAKADPNPQDQEGRTPLTYAVKGGNPEIVKLLLAAKAAPDGGKLDTPLLCAIAAKDAVSAGLLLEAGANVNAEGRIWQAPQIKGQFSPGIQLPSPLVLAASVGDLPLVQLLLKYKADPNDSRPDGQALIFYTLDKPAMLRALLVAGATANASDNAHHPGPGPSEQRTALQMAASQNRVQTVELLLQHGAKPDAADENGFSALHWAANVLADERIFAVLLDHGANPNLLDNGGYTPLAILKQVEKNNQDVNSQAKAEKLMAFLRGHGALDRLPAWDRLSIGRPTTGYSSSVFHDNTNHWNRYMLTELLANLYEHQNNNGAAQKLTFADLAHISVVRPSRNSTNQTRLPVNLLDNSNNIVRSKDVLLAFGDVVEVPEREHALSETADVFTAPEWNTLFSLTKGAVRLTAHGQTAGISFHRNDWEAPIGKLLKRPEAERILSSASDLTRVSVTRQDPQTGKTRIWTLDCTAILNTSYEPAPESFPQQNIGMGIPSGPGFRRGPSANNSGETFAPDFWLENGDVIEVPDRT